MPAQPVVEALQPHASPTVRQAKGTWTVERRDRAIDKKGHPIAQFVGCGHVVRGQEDRCTGVPDFTNQLSHQARVHGIEACRGLVQEQQLRTMKQGAGKRQSTAHAFRELGDELVAVVVEVDTAQQVLRWGRRSAMKAREQAKILEGGQLQIMVRRLECDPDAPVVASIPRAEILAQHRNLALVPVKESDENVLRRALARTARPEKAEDLASMDGKRDTADGSSRRARVAKAEFPGING